MVKWSVAAARKNRHGNWRKISAVSKHTDAMCFIDGFVIYGQIDMRKKLASLINQDQ